MRVRLIAALGLLLLAAGCLSGSSGEDPGASAEPTATASDEEATRMDEAPEVGPLHNPPGWLPGEHWTVEVSSTLLDEPLTWQRVVGGYTQDAYLVGQPAEQAAPGPLLMHIPGMGRVGQTNLSYTVHGTTFTPLQFPLEEGKSWQTRFEGDPVNATVTDVDGDEARVELCCARNITIVYDAELRAIREMTVDDGFLAYEVVDHGLGFDGTVEIPTDREIVFFQGRVAGALAARGDVGPPTGVADVPEDHDRVAFTQIVGNLDFTPGPETGAYLEQAHVPDGSIVTTEQAASTEGVSISFHEAANATGTWRFEHAAAGPGLALTEGIGYRLVERQPN